VKLANPWVFGELAVCIRPDMRTNRTEIFTEPDMIFKADVLFTEKQNAMFREGPFDLCELYIRKWAGQIYIADLCTNSRARGRYGDCLIGCIAACAVHVSSGVPVRGPNISLLFELFYQMRLLGESIIARLLLVATRVGKAFFE
jgi:hypothetical protein